MKHSLLFKYILPFMQWYVLMILITIGIDYLLHRLQLVWVGRYLGYVGTFIVLLSFIYSLRKRNRMESVSPKKLLMLHEYLAWGGSILLLVHAGIHFNAILPWIAIVMLLITVASGLVGKFILKRAANTLNANKQALVNAGLGQEAIDKKLFFDSVMVEAMDEWRSVHIPLAFILGFFSLLHIITIFMFGK